MTARGDGTRTWTDFFDGNSEERPSEGSNFRCIQTQKMISRILNADNKKIRGPLLTLIQTQKVLFRKRCGRRRNLLA